MFDNDSCFLSYASPLSSYGAIGRGFAPSSSIFSSLGRLPPPLSSYDAIGLGSVPSCSIFSCLGRLSRPHRTCSCLMLSIHLILGLPFCPGYTSHFNLRRLFDNCLILYSVICEYGIRAFSRVNSTFHENWTFCGSILVHATCTDVTYVCKVVAIYDLPFRNLMPS